MVQCRFRTIRKGWMGLSTFLSFVTIALAVSLDRFIPHRSYLVVLIGIPSVAVLGGLCAILRKTITRGRSHQRVSAEIAWSFSLLPFQFSISSGHYPPEVSRQFLAIRIIIWMNCALVMSYVMALLTLSVITQLAFDVDVWKRDIDASPSPFPMSIIIPYALPSTARFFSSHSPIPSMTTNITGHSYCLPGCACTRKLLPPQSAPDTSIIPQLTPRTSFAESAGGSTLSSVPVRLPTERERRRSIIVAFEGLNRTLSE